MKCSLAISNFLEEISSFSHSVVFLYFFALIAEEGFLNLLAILWNSAFRYLHLSFYPLPFTPFFSQLFVRPPQTAILLFCISFPWALWTKLVEVMEFQLSCFKSWKMILWKCCTQYARKFGKLSSGHRTGRGQFSFQFQRKAMPKNAQTTAQLHSSHMLVR